MTAARFTRHTRRRALVRQRRRTIEGFWVDPSTGDAGFDVPAWFAALPPRQRLDAVGELSRALEQLCRFDELRCARDLIVCNPGIDDHLLHELLQEELEFDDWLRPQDVEAIVAKARTMFEVGLLQMPEDGEGSADQASSAGMASIGFGNAEPGAAK